MSTITWQSRLETRSYATAVLNGATRFWFVAAVIGQWLFLYYIAAFYGPSTMTGNFQAWTKNTFLPKGYIAGDTAGNLVFAAHALLAGITSFGGALQLVPYIRKRAMAIHRWNGRVFLVTALAVSVSGLYMVWVRHAGMGTVSSIGITGNAVLIILFSVLAWRTALRRDISSHRAWALRTYVVANGQWFMRVGMMSWVFVNRLLGNSQGFNGPFFLIWTYGCYLLPLAMVELYLRATHAGPRARFAMAGVLVLMTLLMSIGIFGVAMFMWRPLLAKL